MDCSGHRSPPPRAPCPRRFRRVASCCHARNDFATSRPNATRSFPGNSRQLDANFPSPLEAPRPSALALTRYSRAALGDLACGLRNRRLEVRALWGVLQFITPQALEGLPVRTTRVALTRKTLVSCANASPGNSGKDPADLAGFRQSTAASGKLFGTVESTQIRKREHH